MFRLGSVLRPEFYRAICSDVLRMILRFPLAVIGIVLLTCMLFFVIATEYDGYMILRISMVALVTIFISVGASLMSEIGERSRLVSWGIAGLVLVYALSYFLTNTWDGPIFFEEGIYVLLHTLAGVAIIFCAPFFLRHSRQNQIASANYLSVMSYSFVRAVIVGLSLLILGYVAIFSVLELFDLSRVSDIDKLYGYWAVISCVFIAPISCLLLFPSYASVSKKAFDHNVFVAFILRFITIPFIVLYFAILYAYSLRVLSDMSAWPHGIISWMVIGFATFGYMSYIASYAYGQKDRFIGGFRRIFPWVVLPQLGMLFYALYLRIDQYDLTTNRYVGVVFGIWLLLVSLYLAISRSRYFLAVPASLAIFALIFSIGPWSFVAYPLDRQYDRLMIHLERAQIWKDGAITPLASGALYDEGISEVISGIEYVCRFDGCDRLEALFAPQITSALATQKSVGDPSRYDRADRSPYETVSLILQGLNIDRTKIAALSDDQLQPYISLSLGRSLSELYPLDTKGYDRIVAIRSLGQIDVIAYPYISWDPETNRARYHISSEVGEDFTLSLPADLTQRSPSEIAVQDLTFRVKNTQREFVLVFTNLPIKNPKYITTTVDDAHRYLFVEGVALVRDVQ